jgi:hypothetical protein
LHATSLEQRRPAQCYWADGPPFLKNERRSAQYRWASGPPFWIAGPRVCGPTLPHGSGTAAEGSCWRVLPRRHTTRPTNFVWWDRMRDPWSDPQLHVLQVGPDMSYFFRDVLWR